MKYLDMNLYTSRGDGNHFLEQLTWNVIIRYEPLYLERGRKQPISQALVCENIIDMNLYTSRGDGNSLPASSHTWRWRDMNLYTSRGDGNSLKNSMRSWLFGYEPLYLERGRKPAIFVFSAKSWNDMNLYTSRGDGNSVIIPDLS